MGSDFLVDQTSFLLTLSFDFQIWRCRISSQALCRPILFPIFKPLFFIMSVSCHTNCYQFLFLQLLSDKKHSDILSAVATRNGLAICVMRAVLYSFPSPTHPGSGFTAKVEVSVERFNKWGISNYVVIQHTRLWHNPCDFQIEPRFSAIFNISNAFCTTKPLLKHFIQKYVISTNWVDGYGSILSHYGPLRWKLYLSPCDMIF